MASCQNALYALGDARAPARIAMVRVLVGGAVGLALVFPLDHLTVMGGAISGWGDLAFAPQSEAARTGTGGLPHLGIVGVALGVAVSSWLEYRLLSTAVARRIGRTPLGGRWIDPISVASIAAALVACVALLAFGELQPLLAAPLILGPAGLAYLAVAYAMRVPEATATFDRARALRSGRRAA